MKKSLIIIALIVSSNFINGYSQDFTNDTNTEKYSCGLNKEFILQSSQKIVYQSQTVKFGSAISSSIVSCGRFNLVFEDVSLNNNFGFDDPVNGIASQQCACDVANYIQTVFDFPSGDGSPIEIFINQSWYSTFNPLPSSLPTNTLATGGPFYSNSNFVAGIPGFYGGNAYDHIITGNDPDLSNIDGQITVNFNAPFRICGSVSTCGSFDLYSILLHEMTHVMGWASCVSENSSTLLPESIFGSNRYSKYDQFFLYHGDISTGPLTHVINASNPLAPFVNPTIPSGALTSSKIWMSSEIEDHATSNQNNPVYSRSSFITNSSPPNTTSHFYDGPDSFDEAGLFSPGFIVDYVMGPFFDFNQSKLSYSLQELRALNILGYVFKSSFLVSNTLNPIYSNSDVINNIHPYTTKFIYGNTWYYTGPDVVGEVDLNSYTPSDFTINNCDSLIIDFAIDNRLKDANGDALSVYPGSLYNIRGCGNGGNNHNGLTITPSATGDIIKYIPRSNFVGRAQFGFYLYDGKEVGAFMIYTIDVLGCNTCDSNLVLNSGFEEGMEIKTMTHNTDNSPLHYSRVLRYFPKLNRIFPDGQIFTNYGNVLVRSSYFCDANDGWFGQSYHSFSPGAGPVASFANFGDRYFNLCNRNNYFRLCSSPINCNRYILEFDYSSSANYIVDIGFTDSPISSLSSIPLVSQSTNAFLSTSGGWQHMSIPINYCSSVSSTFLVMQTSDCSIYIDNLNLHLDSNPPSFTINITPDSSTIAFGTSISLLSNVSNPMCNTTYLWQPGGLTNSIESVSPVSNTTYTLVASDGCSSIIDSTVVYVDNLTNTNNLINIDVIDVYPNPGEGVFILSIQDNNESDFVIAVESVLGQMVYSGKIKTPKGKSLHQINLSDFSKGIYFLRISNMDSEHLIKIIYK